MNLEIKECRNAEIVKHLVYELRKLENAFDIELKDAKEITEKLVKWMNKKLKSPNTFLFVAFYKNKAIAYIFGWIEKRSKNYWKENKYGYICDLFVKKEFRRKGIGKILLEKAENWFKEKRIKSVHLEAYAENPYIGFYEKMKYKKLSIRFVKHFSQNN